MRSRLAQYIIIAILVIIAYVPLAAGDFVFDDQTLIQDNSYITQLQSLSSYLSQEDGIVAEQDKGLLHTGYYRPLVNVTYFLDYKLWGMKAYGFRITNLLLHLLACFLLYELLFMLIGSRPEIFWAVLLFAVHPVHTETVSIIVSRNNILATIFIIASFYAYIVWWQKGTSFAWAVSLLSFTGAVFSKEFGLMVLPVFFLYQRLLTEERGLGREIISYVPYLIILFIYLALRKTVVSVPLYIPEDILLRIAYIPYLLAYNLKLIFLPYSLHSFAVLYPDSLLTPSVLGAFFLVIFLGISLYIKRKDSLLIFSVAAFFLTLLPVLNVINKASVSLIAMRWLYLPMAFLSLAIVRLMTEVKLEVTWEKSAKRIVLLAVVVYFIAGSYTLNAHLWRDQETFLKQEVVHFANKAYMGDYAEMMLKKKQYREAEYFFRQSLQKDPLLARDFINYGALLIETKQPQKALDALEKGRFLTMGHQDRADWNNNMGAALTLLGNYKRAHEHFAKALSLDSQNVALHRNLAYLLLKEGRTEEAVQRLQISEKIKLKQSKRNN
ncbi:MAG: Tetratricopeptide repeat protein [Smithella sp. PtaU1.Bin162]|nr:MAG: Tetratricopeptide repeat protein [Smithella sp. PtaU1.Bin162]